MPIRRLAVALLTIAGACRAREAARHEPRAAGKDALPPASRQDRVEEGTFGFASADGGEILALEAVPHPGDVRWAVCSRSTVLPVVFARQQERSPSSTDRATGGNFSNEAGAVFRVAGGVAPIDGTCYLSGDSALVAGVASPRDVRADTCDQRWLRLAAERSRRTALRCWPLVAVMPDAQVFAVEFAVVDTSALASLVLATPTQLVYYDIPARYRGPDEDVWRVDDQGHFSPDNFGFLFVGTLRGARVLAVTWAGSEGEDDYLLLADSLDSFRTVKTTYRYWAPN